MKTLALISSLLLLSLPTLGYCEVYKCVIEGKTIFSQNPCNNDRTPYQSKTTEKSSSKPTYNENPRTLQTAKPNGKVLLLHDPELGINKCSVYPDQGDAQNEYQMSMKMLDLLAPLAQDEKTKKEVESFRNMKLLDSCPSGARIKCYPDLIVFTTDMNDEFTKKHIEDTKKTRRYELWYPNGKDIKKLSDSCSTGIFEILP